MRGAVRVALFAVLVSLATACAPAPPKGPAPEDMVAAANALDQKFVDAFNKADVDGLMATYWNSPNLVSFGPGDMGTHGWDATKAGVAGMFQSMPGGKLEFTETHNDAVGEVVLGWGRWKITVPAEKGPAQVVEGRYSDVKASRDGKWVYIMDHGSVPMAPPPDAAAIKK
jgi:ketosteroid isomerase-like protein